MPPGTTFPDGAILSTRTTHADIGGTDRIELAAKSSVRWPDGVYRQATRLAQYSGMPGNLVDTAVVPSTANTVFVADLPLAQQPDPTREPTQRWRAGRDVAALKIRFYRCDLRKSDRANLNCQPAGDGSLALGTQGGIPLMRVASGIPAHTEPKAPAAAEPFNLLRNFSFTDVNNYSWRSYSGDDSMAFEARKTHWTIRLNDSAAGALRTALGIP